MKYTKPTDPPPQEIAERALEVQATWDERKEWSRAGRPIRTWTAPLSRIGELEASMEEFISDSGEELLR